MKKDIINKINSLVNQFNENNKMIKDQNKQVKTEQVLNDLIQRNRVIQNDCNDITRSIGNAKETNDEIDERLDKIINKDLIDRMVDKYNKKNDKIKECNGLQTKAVASMDKIVGIVEKQVG